MSSHKRTLRQVVGDWLADAGADGTEPPLFAEGGARPNRVEARRLRRGLDALREELKEIRDRAEARHRQYVFLLVAWLVCLVIAAAVSGNMLVGFGTVAIGTGGVVWIVRQIDSANREQTLLELMLAVLRHNPTTEQLDQVFSWYYAYLANGGPTAATRSDSTSDKSS